MYDFIERDDEDWKVSEEYVESLENNLGLRFPEVLRNYYILHNGADTMECSFEKNNLDFCVVLILPLKQGKVSLEKMIMYTKDNPAIPDSFIPIALDEDEDYYYWDSATGKVVYLSVSNVMHPILISENIEEFFEILDKSCE